MSSFSIRLDEAHLISTASRRGYWDEVLLTMSVERVKQDDTRQLVDMRSANLGFMGYGHKRTLASITPLNGPNWEIEVPDLADDDVDIVLAVTMHNIRGMPDQAKERLIAKIASWAVGSAAEEAIEVGSTAGKWLKIGWFGLAGMAIDAVIDELLKDKPVCLGLIMAGNRSISPNNLGGWKYSDGGIVSGVWVAQANGKLSGIPLPAPGPGCNVPSAEVNFAALQRTSLQFGPKINWTKSYAEVDWLDISDLQKMWVEDPFTSDPRYKVVITKGSEPNKDGLDVTIFEKFVDKENYTTVIHNKMYTDVMLERMGLLIPGKNIYGTPNPKALLKPSVAMRASALADFAMAGASESISGPIEFEGANISKKSRVATATPLDYEISPTVVERVTSPTTIMEDHFIHASSVINDLAGSNSSIFANLRDTVVIALPDGILLSFWRTFIKADGKIYAEGLEMRYWRQSNSVASKTDCWLAPPGHLL